MNKSVKFLPLLAASAVVVGCQDYDLGMTVDEIRYKQEFKNAFGDVDPNQDWNLVAQLANGGSATRAYGSKNTPTGDFTITVLPESQAAPLTPAQMKGYSKMLPEIGGSGGNTFETSNLGRVTQNFSVTTNRVVLYPVYWWTSAIDEIGLYYYSDEDGCEAVRDNEGNYHNIVKVPITVSHPEELEYRYTAEPTWARFYNYSFNTYVTAEYINYLANNNANYVICNGTQYCSGGYIPYNFTNGILLEYKGQTSLEYNTDAASANTLFDYYDVPSSYSVVSALAEAFPSKFRCVKDDEYYFATSEGGEHWESVLSFLQTYAQNNPEAVDPAIKAATGEAPLDRTPLGFRSKGIVVDLPANMKIGFYIINKGQQGNAANPQTKYSEGYLNEKMPWTGYTDKDQCYVATYESDEVDAQGNPVRYLAFEDWYGSGDFDLNDIVFRVYGFNDVHDEEDIKTEEGLLVCEDLGNFDFDFNDVVLKLKWRRFYKKTYTTNAQGVVTGVNIAIEPSDEFSITGMAAGGTLRSNVHYKTTDLGEIHTLLNGTAPNIINAGPKFGNEGQTKTFTIEDNNEWNETNYPNGYVSQVFGEGLVSIHVENGTDAQKLVSSIGYKTNGVPQMMLLPLDFNWAQETTPIKEAYSQFETWVSDATATGWISTRDDSKVTLR